MDEIVDVRNVGTGLTPVLHPSTQAHPSLQQSPARAKPALQPFLEGLRQLGLEPTEQQVDQFLRYRQELLDWNTRMNLTAINDPGEVLLKHFQDSLSLL